jgi:hypothetical protein
MSEMNEKYLYIILIYESLLKSVELTSMLSRVYLIRIAVCVIHTSLEETAGMTVTPTTEQTYSLWKKERRM